MTVSDWFNLDTSDRISFFDSDAQESQFRDVMLGRCIRPQSPFLMWDRGAQAQIFKVEFGGKYFAIREALHQQNQFCEISVDQDLPWLVSHCWHKNIVPESKSSHLQLMEWVEGTPLIDWIRTSKRQPADVSCVIKELIQCVITLQERKIVHGDIHPRNVIVTEKLSIRLVDYDAIVSVPDVNQTTTICGLPGYQHPAVMSPKVVNVYGDTLPIIIMILELMLVRESSQWINVNDESCIVVGTDRISNDDFYEKVFRLRNSAVRNIASTIRRIIRQPIEFSWIPLDCCVRFLEYYDDDYGLKEIVREIVSIKRYLKPPQA